MEKKIGVLTYNICHRKTYDTLCLLKARGYKDVSVYAVPLHYKKKFYPLISHRPELNYDIPEPKDFCDNLAYSYQEAEFDQFHFEDDMIFLVCGAGILPDGFIKNHTVINAHPGYIPLARGLDAFKWAVYEQKPIGVTTHLLGDYIDAGEIIERRIIDVKEFDTFHSVANRVYETEIGMLVGALEQLDKKHEFIIPEEESIVHKRMPHEIERELFEKFEQMKKRKE